MGIGVLAYYGFEAGLEAGDEQISLARDQHRAEASDQQSKMK